MENPKVPGMVKTPEELKIALELCVTVNTNDDAHICKKCPYLDEECAKCIPKDALVYIRQLEADNAKKDETIQMLQDGNNSLMNMIDEECEKTVRLEFERDAVLCDMKNINGNICLACKNHYRPDPAVLKFACRAFGELRGSEVLRCGQFEWRGVQEDKEKAELAKRLEIANSSPFPQGMSQAEYFGLVEGDEP